MTSGLPSLLSDCGPDTPDSSIKEEPSEEASEVRIFNIYSIGVNYNSLQWEVHCSGHWCACLQMAQLWTRVHGKEIPGRPRHLLPYRAEEGLRRLSLLLGGNQSLPCQHSQPQPHIDTLIKPPTILSVFFFKSRLNMRCDAQWLWCRHVLVGWNRSMRSTSCSPTCEFTLERSRTSAGWVSFGVGVSLLYRQQVTVLCMKIVKRVQRCCPPCRTVHWNLTPGFLL